jgi:hypothetical protein
MEKLPTPAIVFDVPETYNGHEKAVLVDSNITSVNVSGNVVEYYKQNEFGVDFKRNFDLNTEKNDIWII